MFRIGKKNHVQLIFPHEVSILKAKNITLTTTLDRPLLRCAWANPDNARYLAYHDEEWGVPVHDDRQLFEMLILEGAQAGLSWETILNRRDDYRRAFYNFDIKKIAAMSDDELNVLLQPESKIIRNRLKVYATRRNALSFLSIQREFGRFDTYVWAFVGGTPLQPSRTAIDSIPSQTEHSVTLSKDLKKRGMTFVGPTIIYAFMQAVGMVNDHTCDCFRFNVLHSAQ